jgi:hypothetical protein
VHLELGPETGRVGRLDVERQELAPDDLAVDGEAILRRDLVGGESKGRIRSHGRFGAHARGRDER